MKKINFNLLIYYIFNRFSYLVPVLNQVKMIDFARFSYFVPVLKQAKKSRKKKVFLTVYPGLKK
jgi:hypothetical protein